MRQIQATRSLNPKKNLIMALDKPVIRRIKKTEKRRSAVVEVKKDLKSTILISLMRLASKTRRMERRKMRRRRIQKKTAKMKKEEDAEPEKKNLQLVESKMMRWTRAVKERKEIKEEKGVDI